jgi:hypothetical protein
MDEISSRPIWPRLNVICVTLFLYAAFVVSVFVIPDNIFSGESLSFAFTFSMMQMVEVAVFMRLTNVKNLLLLLLSLLTASVLPIVQIYLVMNGEYSMHTQNVCGYIYMFKELVLFYVSRGNLNKTSYLYRAHFVVLTVWGVLEGVFYFIRADFEYELSTPQKLFSVARLTSFFCLACFTLLRMTKSS